MTDRVLRRLSVRTRIVGGFLILIVLLALLVPLSVANYTYLVERLRQVTHIEARANQTLLLASTRIATSRVNLMRYIDNQVPSPGEALDDTDAAVLFLTEALDQNLITAPNQREAVTAVVKALTDYRTIITDIETARQQNANQDNARTIVQAYRLGNDSGQRIEQVVKDSEDLILAANASVETDAQVRLGFLIASYGIVLIVGLMLTLLIQRSITRPIAKLRNAAEAFREGRLDTTIPVTANDELSLLAQTFNQMAAQLSKSYLDLEQQVQARTEQLRASTDVGRAAVSILDTNQLLREIVNLITDRFGFYYAAVFLADSTHKWAVLREATGAAGRVLKEHKHQLEIGGQSMVGLVMKTRKARIALDVGDEAVRFANPLLPDTRSEIALPLMVGSNVIGALDVQSMQMAAFDEASAAVLQSMADQIAISLSNTMQFQQAQATLQRTRQLYDTSTAISNAPDAANILMELLTKAIPDASAAQLLLYGPRDETGRCTYFEVAASWASEDSTLLLASGTRLPPEQVPAMPALASEPYIIRDATDPATPLERQHIMSMMHMRAMLGYALVASSQPVGLLLIVYREPHAFTAVETQPLQALAGQIAVTVRNLQLVHEQALARQQLDEINQRLTGQAWRQYLKASGGVARKIDVGPGVPGDVSASPLPAALSAPVLIHGTEVGRLRLEDAAPDREWTANETALIQAVAGEVAIAVENARLIEQTERRAQREARLNQIAQQLRQATDMQSILQTAAEQLSQALDTSHAQAQLGTPQGGTARPNGEHETMPENTN